MNVKLACPHCGKKYRDRSGMSSHMRSQYPEHFKEWRKGSVSHPKPRRHYHRRISGKGNRIAESGNRPAQSINFCPRCGADLRPVVVALAHEDSRQYFDTIVSAIQKGLPERITP